MVGPTKLLIKLTKQVARVLKPGSGTFIYITYQPPHLIKPLLQKQKSWSLTVENIGPADPGTIPYLGYIMKKMRVGEEDERSENDSFAQSLELDSDDDGGGAGREESEGSGGSEGVREEEESTLEWMQRLGDVENY